MADMSFTAQMAAKLGLDEKYVIPYGYDKAKVSLEVLKQDRKQGRLILVSALTPTPADALVMGNVDPAGQICNGTPESVREATLNVLESCNYAPNFCISTGCDIPPQSPWANIDAFFAAVEEYYAR